MILPKVARAGDRGIASEDLLDFLFWGLGSLMQPTLHNAMESFEGWQYRQQLRHRFDYLERRKWIERETRSGQLVYRLTALGRLRVGDGYRPEERWARKWDGFWRILIFDLPRTHQRVRQQLLRWLRQNDFGFLQNSVWICPDPIGKIQATLGEFQEDVESLTWLEARAGGRASCLAMVRGAWDFEEINKRYQHYLNLFSPNSARNLAWFCLQRRVWIHAVALDPFLPQALLPPDYLGRTAWQARKKFFGQTPLQIAK